MTIRHLIPCLVAVLATGSLAAAEHEKTTEPGGSHPAATKLETSTVVGAVTAVDTAKHSVTIKDDASGESSLYRPYYKGGNQDQMVKRIDGLKVGDRVSIEYTEAEGRRAITIGDAPKQAEPKSK